MTREEARDKAEMRVYCYMNAGDIDYYFREYNCEVLGKNGKPKKSPNRSEKEEAIINYLTDKMTAESDEKVQKAQAAYEARMRHDVEVITGGR